MAKQKDDSFKGTLERLKREHVLEAEDIKGIVTDLLIAAAEEEKAEGLMVRYQQHLDVMRAVEQRIEDLSG